MKDLQGKVKILEILCALTKSFNLSIKNFSLLTINAGPPGRTNRSYFLILRNFSKKFRLLLTNRSSLQKIARLPLKLFVNLKFSFSKEQKSPTSSLIVPSRSKIITLLTLRIIF